MRGILMLAGTQLDEVERTAAVALADAESLGAAPVAVAARSLAALAALFREDVALAQQRFADCLYHLSMIEATAVPFFPAVTMSMPLAPVNGSLVPVFEESWLLGRRVGAQQGRGYTLSALADAHRLAGDLDTAIDAVRQSVEAFAGIDDAAGLAHALNHLGCIERDRGSLESADGHLREALRIRRQLGDRRGENLTLANLGLLCAAAGDMREGRRYARLALERGEAVDDGPGVGGALLGLAVVELFAGQRHTARALTEQAIEAYQPQGFVRLEAWARLLAAELARDDNDSETLARHGGTAAELFTRLGARIGMSRAAALPIGHEGSDSSRSQPAKAR
jgi:tetratricopeptide (TPR) repeat protein